MADICGCSFSQNGYVLVQICQCLTRGYYVEYHNRRIIMPKEKAAPKKQVEDENFNFIVRIANSDIDGHKRAVIGIQSIKGVGKRVSQIVIKKAG
ncbi:MAG: 30S ribosomal protein S13, partial [Methanomassiliicoccaceae archaeon]|nr:30S ribosomal protein S13 [Methanomassiliicoccaceae archaeon]